ncbi:MAG: NUDIX hydrolase [Sinobacteraceae bacterium]|nr:NUDIX hydrolase [Nevskiaceae bacterium]
MRHPKLKETGEPVTIHAPSAPSSLEAWLDPDAVAVVTPGGAMPAELNGIALTPWKAPSSTETRATAALGSGIDEPAPIGGDITAAGVVIEEPDGRVWVVAPTNAYGGYSATFPKGRLEPGFSWQQAALREAWEESGLQVVLVAHFMDIQRTTTRTRYYRARRVGGSPADMGWESQAVMLVPRMRLTQVVNSSTDLPLLEALIAASG